MNIIPFNSQYIPLAAGLFIEKFKQQRRSVPILLDLMEDPANVTGKLEWLMGQCPGVAAFEDGKLVGYLGWILIDDFRGTQRRGALVPEWGHAAAGENQVVIYRALYRAAAAYWVQAGVQVHAITLLACDHGAVNTWFWNGFGLTVVDAVRPMEKLVGHTLSGGLEVRKADLTDVETLALLEAEHWRHYAEPPTLMVSQVPDSAEDFVRFLSEPVNSAWLAFQNGSPAGYMRFEAQIDGAAAVVEGPGVAGITGAFVRPQHRGRGLATALLDAAQRDYAAQGFTCCVVDFESFNPEAASFWMRYFEPVTLSVIRVPER